MAVITTNRSYYSYYFCRFPNSCELLDEYIIATYKTMHKLKSNLIILKIIKKISAKINVILNHFRRIGDID